MALDMFVNTWISGFQIICNSTKVNKYFVGILNLWIALPMKSHVQRKYSEASFIRDAFIRKHHYPDGFSRERKNST